MSDLLAGLLAPYRAGAAATPTGLGDNPLLSLVLQTAMNQNAAPSFPGGGSGGGMPQGGSGGGGGFGGPIDKGSITAEELASRAAQQAGVPVAWAHDPQFWYQTEHESGLYPTEGWAEIVKAAHADNPRSSAYGIGQFLDATRSTYNLPLHASPLNQLTAMFQYIQDRYGNPQGAYDFRQTHGWY